MVPFQITFGLDQVLGMLNVVDWSKELLKLFYKKCSFTRWHVSKKDQTTREADFLRLMMKNQTRQISTGGPGSYLFDLLISPESVLFSYRSTLEACWNAIINQVFVSATGNAFANIDNLEVRNRQVTNMHFRDSSFTSDELIWMRGRLTVYRKTIKDTLDKYRAESAESQLLAADLGVMTAIFSEQIKPLVQNKVFPVLSVLLRQVNLYDATGDASKFISDLVAKNQAILDDRSSQPTQKFLKEMLKDFILDTMHRYNPQRTRYPQLAKVLVRLFKRDCSEKICANCLLWTSTRPGKMC